MVCVKPPQLLFVLLLLFVFLCNEMKSMAVLTNMDIGAIVDTNTRVGKEVKTAIEIAVQNFNDHNSINYMISPHFVKPDANPLGPYYAAEALIKDNKVQVIITMKPWQETALIADVGSQAKIPILSLTSGAITPPLASVRWPFLVQIGNNFTQQVKCIADMVLYYKWRRVIAIYEDDTYGGDSGLLPLLSEALQNIGSEIEHRLIFPPYSSLKNSTDIVRDEMVKLLTVKSRVFIVLGASIPLANHLFDEAKRLRFISRDTAWIVTSSIADQFDSLQYSVISSMEGVLGLKTYFPQDTCNSSESFCFKFREKFNSDYPREDNKEPGVYALRAYDGITAITLAIKQFIPSTTNPITTISLLKNILSITFDGLSGKIHFKDGELSQVPLFRITNVIAKGDKELGFWTREFGFSQDLVNSASATFINREMVQWPGNLFTRSPKGWAMPTDEKPMNIGVPGRESFQTFVKVKRSKDTNEIEFDGFCIDLFKKILDVLQKNYSLPYEFHEFNGTYDDLVNGVSTKTYDAIIGDITILASRSKYVEFTQAFAESGLTLITPVQEQEVTWIFMKPFTVETWIVTWVVLMYTVLIVWLLEHHLNPQFRGPWKSQVGTALWFTFSSLFFAHRETIHNNLTRIVVIIWLFVVLILTRSYTASLTSMLTVQRLQPNITDINMLLRTKAMIGCDGDSFVRKYLVNVLNFDDSNVKNVATPDDYPREFKSGNISAAFLELPYQKVFMNKYCKKYTATLTANRFGGLGFVFQKGSPIARDFSEAILILSENGELKELSDKWFTPPKWCSLNTTITQTDSLSLKSFIGLYLISGTTSTLCAIIFLVRLLIKHRQNEEHNRRTSNPSDESVWIKTVKLFRYFNKGGMKKLSRVYSVAPVPTLDDGLISPVHDSGVSPVHDSGGGAVDSTPIRNSSFDRSPAGEIEIVEVPGSYESLCPPTQTETQ